MKQGLKRLMGFFLAVALVFTLLPTTAFAAGFTSTQSLPTAAGSTLYSGNIYKVSSNITISAGTGGNGLNVASGATVVINIASGYTLTVNGGSASGQTAGGAGIYLPNNSTLILTGGGRLIANGGNGAAGGQGETGGNGRVDGTVNPCIRGDGGQGGVGGGGAGAGIGGMGGTGGNGGPRAASQNQWFYVSQLPSSGSSGNNGSSGYSATSMGALYVLGTVTVQATAGRVTSNSTSRSNGGSSASQTNGNARGYYVGAGGGGGGGQGGYGSAAANIGGGGAGGGGGGSGGNGTASAYITSQYATAGGCGGSGGAPYGLGGLMSYSSTNWSNHGNSAADRIGGARAPSYIYSNLPCSLGGSSQGGSGGAGGNIGTGGSGGVVYKAPTATVNGTGGGNTSYGYGAGAGISSYSGIPSAVNYSVSFDQQGGTGGSGSFAITFGTYLPTVTTPSKSQYAFMGYYTAPNGAGTRYYDQRGAGLFSWDSTSDLTLYAYWVQNQFNITFDRQSGTGGTASILTSGTDGTLTSITPPTRQYYTFGGYFDKAAGAGTQYFDSTGAPIAGRKVTANTVLYANWAPNQWAITFNRQNGTGGTASIYSGLNGTLPAISPPTKTGYSFTGYWSAESGGTQYYNASGNGVSGLLISGDTTFYAQWSEKSYSISYTLDGGTISGNPTTRLYTKSAVIPAPQREGYTFMGWQVDGGSSRSVAYTVPANTAQNTVLQATWAKTIDTEVVISGGVTVAGGNEAELKADLGESFNTIVTEQDKGVTIEDLAGDKSVKLVISVDQSSSQDDHGLIGEIAQGSALTFYDIQAIKEVSSAGGGAPTTTILKEVPAPLTVKIPLTGELANKSAYVVYRVHDGAASRLPLGPTDGEYYSVEDGNIVIRTRKFSTYGVIGSERQISSNLGDTFLGGENPIDVQGRIVESVPGLVYKIDINWGPMKFEYSLDREWDPVTHMYSEGALNSWRPVSFDGENNRVRTVSHSNGDVKLNLAITENRLTGVNMSLHIFNEATAEPAVNFILPKAPIGAADADLQPGIAYLFLRGSPQVDWIDNNKDVFTKVGVITVTVEPYTAP